MHRGIPDLFGTEPIHSGPIGGWRRRPTPVARPFAHRPVLLSESLAYLDPRPDAVIVDGTVGGGGHASAILERTEPNGLLIALDRDPAALEAAAARLAAFGERVRLVRASFRALRQVLDAEGIDRVDGVLLDPEMVDGAAAVDLGLADELAEDGQALAAAVKLARSICAKASPSALAATIPGTGAGSTFNDFPGKLVGDWRYNARQTNTGGIAHYRPARPLLRGQYCWPAEEGNLGCQRY